MQSRPSLLRSLQKQVPAQRRGTGLGQNRGLRDDLRVRKEPAPQQPAKSPGSGPPGSWLPAWPWRLPCWQSSGCFSWSCAQENQMQQCSRSSKVSSPCPPPRPTESHCCELETSARISFCFCTNIFSPPQRVMSCHENPQTSKNVFLPRRKQ